MITEQEWEQQVLLVLSVWNVVTLTGAIALLWIVWLQDGGDK